MGDLRTDDTRFLGNKVISLAPRALQGGRGWMGNFPRVRQLRFLGAAHKTLMNSEPPPEHVRE